MPEGFFTCKQCFAGCSFSCLLQYVAVRAALSLQTSAICGREKEQQQQQLWAQTCKCVDKCVSRLLLLLQLNRWLCSIDAGWLSLLSADMDQTKCCGSMQTSSAVFLRCVFYILFMAVLTAFLIETLRLMFSRDMPASPERYEMRR